MQALECGQTELTEKATALGKELGAWHAVAGNRVSAYTTQLATLQDELLQELKTLKGDVSAMRKNVREAVTASNASYPH